jgi:hypothetical protein
MFLFHVIVKTLDPPTRSVNPSLPKLTFLLEMETSLVTVVLTIISILTSDSSLIRTVLLSKSLEIRALPGDMKLAKKRLSQQLVFFFPVDLQVLSWTLELDQSCPKFPRCERALKKRVNKWNLY